MELINRANDLFSQYRTKRDSISPDLKEEIYVQKKNEVEEEYHDAILTVIGELSNDADQFAEARGIYSDKNTMLAIDAVNSADKMTPGDVALVNSLSGLPQDMIATIAGHTSKPGVQLALYQHAVNTGDADLKAIVVSRVQLPVNDIKSAAMSEKRCLESIFNGPQVKGYDGSRRLEIGHRINDLNKIIEE